jgi:hypothetical protein
MLQGRIYPRSRLWRPPFEAERRFVQSDAMQGGSMGEAERRWHRRVSSSENVVLKDQI